MSKISVVMPVYNGEKYLEESINSIIMQEYEDWELIIVNDASTDRTKDIIHHYVESDDRIRCIDNVVNSGISISLNTGFSNATGEYYTWTSDDNRYLENALSVMSSTLDENADIDFVYANSYVIDKNGVRVGELDLQIDFFYNDCYGACFMYRREKAELIDGYNPYWSLIQDYEYWLRLNQVCKVKFLKEYLYEYRMHPENLTSTKSTKLLRQRDELRFKMLDYIIDNISEEYYEPLFIDLCLKNRHRHEELIEKFFGGAENLPERLEWIFSRKYETLNKEYVIFGCGDYGKKTVELIGKEHIAYFIDNNKDRVGKTVSGISVLEYKNFIAENDKYGLIVAIGSIHIQEVVNQLAEDDIRDFVTYLELCMKYDELCQKRKC